jgi:hypothetical protein
MAVETPRVGTVNSPVQAVNNFRADFNIARSIGALVEGGLALKDKLDEGKFKGQLNAAEQQFRADLEAQTIAENTAAQDLIGAVSGEGSGSEGPAPEVQKFLTMQAKQAAAVEQGVTTEADFKIAMERELREAIASNPRLTSEFTRIAGTQGGLGLVPEDLQKTLAQNELAFNTRTARLKELRSASTAAGVNQLNYERNPRKYWEETNKAFAENAEITELQRKNLLAQETGAQNFRYVRTEMRKAMPSIQSRIWATDIKPVFEQVFGTSDPVELNQRIQDGTVTPEMLSLELQNVQETAKQEIMSLFPNKGNISDEQWTTLLAPIDRLFASAISGLGTTVDMNARMAAIVSAEGNAWVSTLPFTEKHMDFYSKLTTSGNIANIAAFREFAGDALDAITAPAAALSGADTVVTGRLMDENGVVNPDPQGTIEDLIRANPDLEPADMQQIQIGLVDSIKEILFDPGLKGEDKLTAQGSAVNSVYHAALAAERKSRVGAAPPENVTKAYMDLASSEEFRDAYQAQPQTVRALLEPVIKDQINNEWNLIVNVEANATLKDLMTNSGLGIVDPSRPKETDFRLPFATPFATQQESRTVTVRNPDRKRGFELNQLARLVVNPQDGRVTWELDTEADKSAGFLTARQLSGVQEAIRAVNAKYSDRLTDLVRAESHVSFFPRGTQNPYQVGFDILDSTLASRVK